MLELIVFFAEVLGMLFLVLGILAVLYCFLGAFTYRDFKTFKKLLLAVGIWLVVMVLWVWLVPSGELSSNQYSGVAGVMQIVFFIANAALFIFSVKTLRQQTSGPK